MAVVKLPSGKTVKIPDGKTKQEAMEFIFEKLEGKEGFEDDRKRIGDQLNTSGWGATIGGAIGGVAGGVGGIFTSPSLVVNPITLGVAGSGAGAALGEGIEQWLTGKGDAGDIAYAGGEGAAWGAIPGVGGQVAKGLGKAGVRGAGQIAGSAASGSAAGAGLGAGGASITGQDVGTGAAVGAIGGALGGAGRGGAKLVVDDVVKNVGKNLTDDIASSVGKEVFGSGTADFKTDVIAAAKKFAKGWVKSKAGRPTGKFQMAEAKLDLRRAATSALTKDFAKKFGRDPNKVEIESISKAAKQAAEDAFDYKAFRDSTLPDAIPEQAPIPKPKAKNKGLLEDALPEPNIKERAIAAGIDLPGLEGGVVRPEVVTKARANQGWNYSGKPAGEFAKDMDQVHKGLLDSKFLTDTEVVAKESGLLGDLLQNAGSATLDDVKIANEIAEALTSTTKGNQSKGMIIDDILSKADHSKLNINGIAGAISEKLGISYKEAKLLLINSKYAFD